MFEIDLIAQQEHRPPEGARRALTFASPFVPLEWAIYRNSMGRFHGARVHEQGRDVFCVRPLRDRLHTAAGPKQALSDRRVVSEGPMIRVWIPDLQERSLRGAKVGILLEAFRGAFIYTRLNCLPIRISKAGRGHFFATTLKTHESRPPACTRDKKLCVHQKHLMPLYAASV